MKKYTIISLFAIIIGITYFVVRANAMPQAAKHELMNVSFDDQHKDELNVSKSDGEFVTLGLAKGDRKEDISQVLIKLKEFEEQGWTIKSINVVPYYNSMSLNTFTIYSYSFER